MTSSPDPAASSRRHAAATAPWARFGVGLAACGYALVAAIGLATDGWAVASRRMELWVALASAAAFPFARRWPQPAALASLLAVFAELAWSLHAEAGTAPLAVVVFPLLVAGAGAFVGIAGAFVAAGAGLAAFASWLAMGRSLSGRPIYELAIVAIVLFGSAAMIRAALRAYAGVIRSLEEAARRAEAGHAERRRLDDQLRHAQRLESVGQLAGGVAHDFNNLLTAVAGNAAVLAEHADPEVRELAAEIREAQERGSGLTRQLLAFARREARVEERLDAAEVAGGVRRLAERLLGARHRLVVEASGPAHVRVDRGQLEQVLLNLVANARDALPDPGDVMVRVQPLELAAARSLGSELAAARQVLLEVRDQGVGMTPEVRARIFEPFFTTKPRGQGTGLGLSTVHGIVAQSGGHVAVETAPGAGATFRVFLPASAETPAGDAPRPGAAPPRGGDEAILLVEDDPHVRALAHRVLARAGYRVTAASNGGEALAFHGSVAPRLLVTDVAMPGMDGFELAARLREGSPHLRVLFMSGYYEQGGASPGGAVSPRDVLAKPFQPEELLRRVRAALDGG
jgi:signal transduction histidine kinase